MNPDFAYETARLHQVLCEGVCNVTSAEVEQFRRLMGYAETPPGQVPLTPPSMGLTYGLKLGWENAIFAPGVIRMGDEDMFGVAARVGDRLVTQFRIVGKFEKKGRKFMQYEMRTQNQKDELVCSVSFTVITP